MDRRTSIKWMLAASAAFPVLRDASLNTATAAEAAAGSRASVGKPYGTDPKLLPTYKPGDLWPLTLTAEQRATAKVLSDLIIPADATSPSASAVGVVEFIDEWLSAPYAAHAADRTLILDGFKWLDEESTRRFARTFRTLDATQQRLICDDICYLPKAQPQFVAAATFFKRYRDLTAGGFYTTPQGRSDLQYVGNVPLATFTGPPPEVLKKAGLV